jgi:hypothetical protein
MRGYTERAQSILKFEKQGEISRKIQQLKYDLISVYCSDVVKDFTVYSLRVQHTNLVSLFLQTVQHAPAVKPFEISTFDPDCVLQNYTDDSSSSPSILSQLPSSCTSSASSFSINTHSRTPSLYKSSSVISVSSYTKKLSKNSFAPLENPLLKPPEKGLDQYIYIFF